MPLQTDSATPTRLSSIRDSTDALIGRKLRVAGRMLSYDVETGISLIMDGDTALLVDVSPCIDPFGQGRSKWVRETKSVIMTIGYLERSAEQLPIPILPAYTPAPAIDPSIVLRTLLVTPAPDLDMVLWNRAIQANNQLETGT